LIVPALIGPEKVEVAMLISCLGYCQSPNATVRDI